MQRNEPTSKRAARKQEKDNGDTAKPKPLILRGPPDPSAHQEAVRKGGIKAIREKAGLGGGEGGCLVGFCSGWSESPGGR